MTADSNTTSLQFNKYKYDELSMKLLPLLHDVSQYQLKLGLDILHDYCWTWKPRELSEFWQQQYGVPNPSSSPLSLLHYNIQYFCSNQVSLIDMVNTHGPTIISLNELGMDIPPKSIKQLLFSYNIYTKLGTNSHGGVILAIDKRLKSEIIDTKEPNIIATRTVINNQQFTIASIYSPPTEPLPLSVMNTLVHTSKHIIISGDLNAKHPDWGCSQTNTKGRILADWLNMHNLNVLNFGMKTSLRSETTIDLIISSETSETSDSRSLAYSCSDHLPVFTQFLHLNVYTDNYLVPRTYWKIYSSILTVLYDQLKREHDETSAGAVDDYNWFLEFQWFLAGLKLRVTRWQQVKRKRPSISASLRILLRHKHFLQNRYRHTRKEEDRLRVKSWNVLIKHEFKTHKRRNWENFISSVASPNPSTFWRTVRTISKKKSVDFVALTDDNNTIHRSPKDIVECLQHHFAERHGYPDMCANSPLNKEAVKLWQIYALAEKDDIKLVCNQSDLQFNTKDIEQTIRSLKNKNSSGFDHVSNKMVKLLPAAYHTTLTSVYNGLFREAFWGVEWKLARTICLNKSDNPSPTTNQLRPISILPVFSKVYERLFLIRFNGWVTRTNILPEQQSGSRPHQATTSRVNCLLEQITQSLRYNTFTPVVYIDFLQA